MTRSDTVGGVHTHILDLLKCLRCEHDVHVICGSRSPDSPFLTLLDNLNIKYSCLFRFSNDFNPLNDVHSFFNLLTILNSLSPDLVAIHSSKAGLFGRIACFVLGIKSTFTIHGWSFNSGSNLLIKFSYLFLEYLLQNLSSVNICVSRNDFRQMCRLGFNKKKFICIPNTAYHVMDQSKFNSSFLERNYTKLRIVCVARFDKQKDQSLLIRCLSLIDKCLWELTFVGDGPTLSICQDLCRSLDLEDNIYFSGHCDDVISFYSSANLFILPSKWEGLPITLLEALSSGLPIIATDVGGVSECVMHGSNGFLVTQKSLYSLYYAINRFLLNFSLLQSMSIVSRGLFDSYYSREKFIKDTIFAYRSSLTNS